MKRKSRSKLNAPTKLISEPSQGNYLSRLLESHPPEGIDSYQAAAELYRQEPLTWLLSSDYLERQVFTQDEHDDTVESKAFPDKAYIRQMVGWWLSSKMNLWEKSRQIMASWLMCALYLHDTQFGMGRRNFIQSKKELDSDALLRRCYFIWFHQEPWLKALFPAEYTYCHLRFFKPGQQGGLPYSELHAIPQGGDILRQYTASGLFIDEGAFQPDLESSIRSAGPMLKGGGRIDVVSSAEPGYFQLLCEGRMK